MFNFKVKERVSPEGLYSFAGSALLLSPFAKILSGVLLAGLITSVSFNGVQLWKSKALEIRNATLSLDLAHAKSELRVCGEQIDRQNSEIDRIREDAERDRELIDKFNDQLNYISEMQGKEIERLKNTPAPQTCEEAAEFMSENLGVFDERN